MRWLGFVESLCIVIGVTWSTTILMYNTGDYPDNKMAKYLKDRNSLSTTLAVTFIIPFILCFIHLVMRMIFVYQTRKNMQEQASMASQLESTPDAESRRSFISRIFGGKDSDLTDGFQKFQHISYDIEA